MDIPFPPSAWQPSDPSSPPPTDLTALIHLLALETATIKHYPYDPTSWLRRARTLSALRYPELAVGDAHKAALLCRKVVNDLDVKITSRLGFRGGFWMRISSDEADGEEEEEWDDEALEGEKERQRLYFGYAVLNGAEEMMGRELFFAPNSVEGRCVLVEYPWVKGEWRWRGQDVLGVVNRELEEASRGSCEVKRYAFGEGVGARDGEDLLGVFAKTDIEKGDVVLVDVGQAWGCNGPGTNGTRAPLFGGTGCLDPIHPNNPDEDKTRDLRWVRDRAGRKACDALVKCRMLQCCIADGVEHPLDHHLIARLTPLYERKKSIKFSLESDIAVLDDALQQFGIDIFANLNYDTWTFFVLMARTDNNCWSDPNTAGLNGIFSLFNHSCDENIQWQIGDMDDHRTITISAARDIQAHEQLLVCYDAFMKAEPLEKRRKRFWRWLEGPCQCTRCLYEEAGQASDESLDNSFSSSSSWDMEDKPVFPEDKDTQQTPHGS